MLRSKVCVSRAVHQVFCSSWLMPATTKVVESWIFFIFFDREKFSRFLHSASKFQLDNYVIMRNYLLFSTFWFFKQECKERVFLCNGLGIFMGFFVFLVPFRSKLKDLFSHRELTIFFHHLFIFYYFLNAYFGFPGCNFVQRLLKGQN